MTEETNNGYCTFQGSTEKIFTNDPDFKNKVSEHLERIKMKELNKDIKQIRTISIALFIYLVVTTTLIILL